MANTTLTADLILKEAHRLFKNNTPFLQGMYRDYDNTYEAYGAKSGDSVRIRKPMQYQVRTGKTTNVQDNIESSVTLAKTTQKGIDLKFSSAELTQDINRFSELYVVPAINALASNIENDIMTQAVNATYSQVGTQGTDPASFLVHTQAGAKLTNFSTPNDTMRSNVLNPNGMATTVDALKGLFQDSTKIRDQYVNAQMGTGLGFEFAETPNVPTHTNGTSNGAYVVDGASQVGSLILVKTGAGTWTKGDVITFAGVNALNPTTKVSLGSLAQFVVTTNYAGGAGSVQISPAIVTSGALQNVTASPANLAVIAEPTGWVAGATNAMNLAYHKNAFAFGTVDLDMPPVNYKARQVVDGISMRLVGDYDVINDDVIYRLDILYGFIAVTPEWSCRIAGK